LSFLSKIGENQPDKSIEIKTEDQPKINFLNDKASNYAKLENKDVLNDEAQLKKYPSNPDQAGILLRTPESKSKRNISISQSPLDGNSYTGNVSGYGLPSFLFH
jgi:hypothetical protein